MKIACVHARAKVHISRKEARKWHTEEASLVVCVCVC